MKTTSPGFSSRTTEQHTSQFAQRDERMIEKETEPGWSNSAPADHAPQDVEVEVTAPEELVPGFSNDKAVASKGSQPEVEAKVVEPEKSEDKAVKKTAAKKKG